MMGGNATIRETLYASAARTATPTASIVSMRGRRGVQIVIVATASADTPSVVATVQCHDALSDTFYTVLTSAAITGAGTTVLTVYPGATAVANVSTGNVIPDLFKVVMTHADGDSITYSVSAHLLP